MIVCPSLTYSAPTTPARPAATITISASFATDGKLCGDVDYAAVEPIVDAITPVPGGVGSVTTSVLVGHVVEAAMRKVNG